MIMPVEVFDEVESAVESAAFHGVQDTLCALVCANEEHGDDISVSTDSVDIGTGLESAAFSGSGHAVVFVSDDIEVSDIEE